jgi:uncharacterized protein YdeI (YjbR/CyaY-like superfamily)
MRGEFLLGLNRSVREAAGVQAGESVEVEVMLDPAQREVAVPEELAAALADDPVASAAFEKLSFSHRKEYARRIAEAKRAETRDRRLAQALQMLRDGRTRS